VLNTPPPHDGALLGESARPQSHHVDGDAPSTTPPHSFAPSAATFAERRETMLTAAPQPIELDAAIAPRAVETATPDAALLFDELAERLERAAADMGIGEV
jgi:hypothetical protein